MPEPASLRELETVGRVWFRKTLDEDELARFDRACQLDRAPGVRLQACEELARCAGASSTVARLADSLQPGARPVRYVAFNKSPDANWQVPWHQDRVIAVRERHPVGGFDNWTQKAGTWHVEPPADYLRDMIFARIHLDDTNERNGCLELALRTHLLGRISADVATDIAQDATVEPCRARRGDILFVKALTLHSSKRSQIVRPRRTLRIDFCARDLPSPLAWAR